MTNDKKTHTTTTDVVDRKEFGNLVQVDTDQTLFNRTVEKPPSEEERKLREKTAHIGYRASQASQGGLVGRQDLVPPAVNKKRHENDDGGLEKQSPSVSMQQGHRSGVGDDVENVHVNRRITTATSDPKQEHNLEKKTEDIGLKASQAADSSLSSSN
jgi:hypothetical protein